MAKKSNCNLLPGPGVNQFCKKTCGSCGWSPRVAAERDRQIATRGLTKGPDGLHRLIVKGGGNTNGEGK